MRRDESFKVLDYVETRSRQKVLVAAKKKMIHHITSLKKKKERKNRNHNNDKEKYEPLKVLDCRTQCRDAKF